MGLTVLDKDLFFHTPEDKGKSSPKVLLGTLGPQKLKTWAPLPLLDRVNIIGFFWPTALFK